MVIKDILKDTTAIICGRIDSKENSLEKMEGIMEFNRGVLEACHSIVLVLNRGSDVSEKVMTEVGETYRKNFKNVFLLQPHPVGMGHQVGHVTLDKTGYLFAKNNLKTKYTMKLCNDILVAEEFLEKEIEQADVYYIPTVSTPDIYEKYDLVKEQAVATKDYADSPLTYQTWFFIASNNTDILYEPDEEIERVFRTWDIKGDVKQAKVLCCEHSLTKWSVANKLKRHSLFTAEQFENYCKFLLSQQMVVVRRNTYYTAAMDSSMKNVMFKNIGITHFHFASQPVIECVL